MGFDGIVPKAVIGIMTIMRMYDCACVAWLFREMTVRVADE